MLRHYILSGLAALYAVSNALSPLNLALILLIILLVILPPHILFHHHHLIFLFLVDLSFKFSLESGMDHILVVVFFNVRDGYEFGGSSRFLVGTRVTLQTTFAAALGGSARNTRLSLARATSSGNKLLLDRQEACSRTGGVFECRNFCKLYKVDLYRSKLVIARFITNLSSLDDEIDIKTTRYGED